jgi:hypothetical protein
MGGRDSGDPTKSGAGFALVRLAAFFSAGILQAIDFAVSFPSPGSSWRRTLRNAEMAATLLPSNHDEGDRLGEIAEILAVGLIRLQQRKSSPLSRDGGESSLDFPVDQRGHPTPVDRRMADG